VDWTISLPLKEIPLPIKTKKTVEKVMIPNPPVWIRNIVITCPTRERSFPVSMTTRPVTQTAEVEVKRASTNRRFPMVAEKGNHRRIPPVRMTATKLRTKILVGERCLEKKVLIRIRSFIGFKSSTLPMRARVNGLTIFDTRESSK
jgi:hypothetical protein